MPNSSPENLPSTKSPLKFNNSTRPYQNILTFLNLPEPLFIAIIATGSLLILLTCCLITSRLCFKSCFWSRKSKGEKKKLLTQNDINRLLQDELDIMHGFGKIEFLLRYKLDSQSLTVIVVQLSDLPNPIDGSLDPYVIISTNSKSNKDEKKTKIKMHTETPIFNQKFEFKILKSELHDASITFKALDFDKFGADALLGQLTLQFKDLDIARICNQNLEFSKELEEGEDTCEGMGQICIILNNSKAGLIITILEAKNLRIKEKSNYAFVFIKVKYQVQKSPIKYHTKIVRETKKVSITKFPYFNEVFMFQSVNIPLSKSRIKFKIFMGGKFRIPSCIGYIILGPGSASQSGELHWECMLDSPRHAVAKWHVLVNPNIRE